MEQQKNYFEERKLESLYGVPTKTEKKPYDICESVKFPGRYQPAEKCRDKEKYSGLSRVNLNEVRDDIQQS